MEDIFLLLSGYNETNGLCPMALDNKTQEIKYG